MREITERAFESYGAPLENLTAFKYLGRVMTAVDGDWPTMVVNLQKARNIWGWFSRIFIREGADPKVSGIFFKAVTQAVLLLGEETRVLTPGMERSQSIFQHKFLLRIAGGDHRRREGGSCG